MEECFVLLPEVYIREREREKEAPGSVITPFSKSVEMLAGFIFQNRTAKSKQHRRTYQGGEPRTEVCLVVVVVVVVLNFITRCSRGGLPRVQSGMENDSTLERGRAKVMHRWRRSHAVIGG